MMTSFKPAQPFGCAGFFSFSIKFPCNKFFYTPRQHILFQMLYLAKMAKDYKNPQILLEILCITSYYERIDVALRGLS